MTKEIEHINIKEIKDPSVVKKLGYPSLNLLCEDIRKEIIKETSQFGGHLASNLGVVELTVALYRFFDFPNDKLIFDVGHQCYAHKILTGRNLEKLNCADGISGFIKRSESEYDCFEAGHSSTSLSAAQAFAIARDLKGEKHNVIALIGDAAIANGLSFEALNNIGTRKNKIIIILNDNDMSIGRPVGSLGDFFRKISTARGYNRFKSSYRRVMYRTAIGRGIYSFSSFLKRKTKQILVPTTMFDHMGFTYVGPVDGHNIKALEKAFKRAENATKSVVIHVYTNKGKGYGPAEKDENGYWHSVTPFDVKSGGPLHLHPGEISWSHFMGDQTYEALKTHDDALLICPAMMKGSHLENCFADFRERCFDVGIAEEHAATFAGALSLTGYHPILCIYSTFLQRAYDEISHDCARINADMTLLIERAGLCGKYGETHMGIYDEAFLKSIPNVIVTMPSTFEEAQGLMNLSLEKGHGVFAIRYPHSLNTVKENTAPESIHFLKWKFLGEIKENRPAIIAVGPHGHELFELLQKAGFDGTLINPLFLNPIDEESVKKILPASEVIIYDAYGTENGFAESVEKYLLENQFGKPIKVFALPNSFIQHDSVKNQEILCGVSVNQVFDFIEKI